LADERPSTFVFNHSIVGTLKMNVKKMSVNFVLWISKAERLLPEG